MNDPTTLTEPTVPGGDSADVWAALREFELRRESYLVVELRAALDKGVTS